MDSDANNTSNEAQGLEPLIALAGALLDTDRLRVAAALASAPANRVELARTTGLSHKNLLRHLGVLQYFGVVRPEGPASEPPDDYTRYRLNLRAFQAARQAMGRYMRTKPRPADPQQLTLEIFMPGGRLVALPRKRQQLLTVLDQVARRFDAGRQYSEREVNVIIEGVYGDYCTLRRLLVDYGYMSRVGQMSTGGVYELNPDRPSIGDAGMHKGAHGG
jgi:hypothetical protein